MYEKQVITTYNNINESKINIVVNKISQIKTGIYG